MKHVLITGGAGFIGSHLCEAFLERGYAVTAVDNLLTGRSANLDRARRNPRFDFVAWNVSLPLPTAMMPHVARHGLWGVLHFAGTSSPADLHRTPFELLEASSLGTMNSIDLALRHDARYILASEPGRAGEPLFPGDQAVHDTLAASRSEAHHFAEACVATAMSGRGRRKGHEYAPLNAAIARIGSTYGPRMRHDDGRAIPELCRRALLGMEMPARDEQAAARSYLYVEDLVEGVIRLFETDVRLPVEFGGASEATHADLRDLVHLAAKGASSAHHNHGPKRLAASIAGRPAPDRARRFLKWAPRTSLDQGLARTLQYFRVNHPAQREATDQRFAA